MTGVYPMPWRIVSASVSGPSHDARGITNQDAFDTAVLPAHGRAFAVADGAGSRSHSAHGARLAVESAMEAAADVFDGHAAQPLSWWAESATSDFARACLTGYHRRLDATINASQDMSRDSAGHLSLADEYATTLLAVVSCPPYLCYASIGDCFLVVDRAPGGPRLVVPPPLGGTAMNETTFLTSPLAETDVRYGVIVDDAICGIALCSDGLYEGLLDAKPDGNGVPRPLASAAFRAYFTFFADPDVDASELERKLAGAEFAATSGDDKTIVLAVRQ